MTIIERNNIICAKKPQIYILYCVIVIYINLYLKTNRCHQYNN